MSCHGPHQATHGSRIFVLVAKQYKLVLAKLEGKQAHRLCVTTAMAHAWLMAEESEMSTILCQRWAWIESISLYWIGLDWVGWIGSGEMNDPVFNE